MQIGQGLQFSHCSYYRIARNFSKRDLRSSHAQLGIAVFCDNLIHEFLGEIVCGQQSTKVLFVKCSTLFNQVTNVLRAQVSQLVERQSFRE